MNSVSCHNAANVRLYWARDNQRNGRDSQQYNSSISLYASLHNNNTLLYSATENPS